MCSRVLLDKDLIVAPTNMRMSPHQGLSRIFCCFTCFFFVFLPPLRSLVPGYDRVKFATYRCYPLTIAIIMAKKKLLTARSLVSFFLPVSCLCLEA